MKGALIATIGLLVIGSTALGQSLDQQVMASSSGMVETDSVKLVYTIGQVLDDALDNGSITLLSGFISEGEFTVSVEEILVGVEFKVYPNPASEEVNLLLTTDNRLSLEADVMSLNGQQIGGTYKKWEMAAGVEGIQRFDVRSLSTGTYVIRLISSSSKEVLETFKFQVVR